HCLFLAEVGFVQRDGSRVDQSVPLVAKLLLLEFAADLLFNFSERHGALADQLVNHVSTRRVVELGNRARIEREDSRFLIRWQPSAATAAHLNVGRRLWVGISGVGFFLK